MVCDMLPLVLIALVVGSWLSVPFLFLSLVVVLIISLFVVKRMDVNAIELSRVTGRWTGRVVEVCDAIRTVKSFSAEPHVLAHVNELTTERQLLFRRSRVYFIAVVGAATPTMNFARYSLLLTAAYVARS